jgi:MYXO-CTERM domain-containing protein
MATHTIPRPAALEAFASRPAPKTATPWIRRSERTAILLAIAGCALGGCSAAPLDSSSEAASDSDGVVAEDPRLGSGLVAAAESALDTTIYGGVRDGDSRASASVVALRIGPTGLCTGTLVAPNLVLTARHCVSETTARIIACTSEGKSTNGDHFGADRSTRDIAVFTGVRPEMFGAGAAAVPAAGVRAIVRTSGKVLCNADVAFLVLDRAIANVPTATLRLTQPTPAGESLRTVGYGLNDTTEKGASGSNSGVRLRREGVSVRAHGPMLTRTATPLGPSEIEVGQSVCSGDSGGPAFSERTGALVAVVSRGPENCAQDSGQILTTLTGFQELVRAAFAQAGATPTAEAAVDGTVPAPPEEASSTLPEGLSSGASARGADGAEPTAETADDTPGPSSRGCSLHSSDPEKAPWASVALLVGFLGPWRRRRRTSTATSALPPSSLASRRAS